MRNRYLLLTKDKVTAMILLLALWWFCSRLLNKPILPDPFTALQALFLALHRGLISHIWVSFYRVMVSLALAVVLGVPLGLMAGKNPHWDRKLAPLLYLTYPIPKVVFMPILFVLLGIGDISKIVLIALIVFYQIVVSTRDAARNLNSKYVLSVQSLGANSLDMYRHVFLPGCMPEILTALRIGLGTAMAVLFLTETYATQEGLGYFIMEALARMAYAEMFAGIIAMGALGFILYYALDRLQNFLCPWISL